MRAAASLDRTDLNWTGSIADVEDSQAAVSFGADIVANSLKATVKTSTGFLYRHEQEILYYR